MAILILGLPHGALDYMLLKKTLPDRPVSLVVLFGVYLGFAFAMLGLWAISPVIALIAFFLCAMYHFSEDFEGPYSKLIAIGWAAALLAAPAMMDRNALDPLFIMVAGDDGATMMSDLLILVGPTGGVLALAGIIMLIRTGLYQKALVMTGSVLAMLALPPLIGFALYFCLYHSPKHFHEGLQELRHHASINMILGSAFLINIAAVIIIVMIGLALPDQTLESRSIASLFIGLSILTVPHLLMPYVARSFAARYSTIS